MSNITDSGTQHEKTYGKNHFSSDKLNKRRWSERRGIMILAEKIMKLRKQNGWSQEELACMLNVSRQSVSKWESGASIPDLDKILKISQIFEVSTDYLLKDEIEEEPGKIPEISYEEELVREDELVKTVSLSLEEADAYMGLVEKVSKKIAAGVAAMIRRK